MVAAIADPTCDSSTHPTPARSLHRFTDSHHSACLAGLAGAWQYPGTTNRFWLLGARNSTETCEATGLEVMLADSSFARIQADSLELWWQDADSTGRSGTTLDSATTERYRADSSLIDSLVNKRMMGTRGFITGLRIGGVLFLDIESVKQPPYVLGAGWASPTNWIWRADLVGDSLILRPLNSWWLQERLDSGWTIIGHEDVDYGAVLTASPPAIRRFLGRHVKDTLAFPDSGSIHLGRWQPDSAPRGASCPCPQ
jgi:hypothetical protein